MPALRSFTLGLCVFALAGCASQGMSFWRADEIAKVQTSSLRLHHKGETVAHVNPEQIRLLIDVKNKIERVTPIASADLVLVNLKEPNAFASLRDGRPLIGVSLGMLELLHWDRDAYAAIIGHEYAHLALDHRSARAEREGTAQAARQVVGFALSLAGVPMGQTIANIGVTAIERIYTRDEEREADQLGFGYAIKATFDPEGGVRLWEKMNSAGGFSIPLLSTHPMSSERMETMKVLARSSPEIPDTASSQHPLVQTAVGCDDCVSHQEGKPADAMAADVSSRQIGFAFRDHPSQRQVIVTEVLASRTRMEPGDLVLCAIHGGRNCSAAAGISAGELRSTILLVAKENDEGKRWILLRVRRAVGEEFWRSVRVQFE